VINAEIVLARRTQFGLSQRQLAKRTGVSYMTISRMENGADTSTLPLSAVGRLAHALDLEPGGLLARGPNAHQPTSLPSDGRSSVHLDESPLHHDSARLLRKVHRGDDIRRTMSKVERELILPALIHSGFVTMSVSGAAVTGLVALGLQECSAAKVVSDADTSDGDVSTAAEEPGP
jgi:transcriptional regulator with XRE-family HTH domain